MKYILDDSGEPVSEPDLEKWGRWFETAPRSVGDDDICGVRISTTFLGLDHRFGGGGPPVLWETMVFGGPLNGECERCSGSREQAEAMHFRMVKKVINTPTIPPAPGPESCL